MRDPRIRLDAGNQFYVSVICRIEEASDDITPSIPVSHRCDTALNPVKVQAAKTSPAGFPYTEFEALLRRRDFREMTKDVLPTPCMIVDQAIFERNMKTMAQRTKALGINVRPHVKIHKSVDIAKIQMAHGAIGLTCATIAEAELMSGAGLKNVMWTKQPASWNAAENARLKILVSVYAGLSRMVSLHWNWRGRWLLQSV